MKSHTEHQEDRAAPAAARGLARLRHEAGQTVVLITIAMIPVLGLVGLAVDVGYAWYAKRTLQSSADAAALAGARQLPNTGNAISTARLYSASAGNKNARDNVPNVTTTVTTKCLSGGVCNPANAVVVVETAEVPTFFSRVLGINSFTVSAKLTASGAGATPVPRDVVVVLDRTGSMCQDHYGHSDPGCSDLNNAKNGIKTLLRNFNPTYDWVGLAVLPPATSVSNRCRRPETDNYDRRSNPYVVVNLSSDYLTGANLNNSSRLVGTINCLIANGRTAYANALEKAQAELVANGRASVPDVIIFFSDGAANYGPDYYSPLSPYWRQPCHQGIWSAATIKAAGTLIYTIGYDLDAEGGTVNNCETTDGYGEQPRITAREALEEIASGPEFFYDHPSDGDLTALFQHVAADVLDVRLVDNDLQ